MSRPKRLSEALGAAAALALVACSSIKSSDGERREQPTVPTPQVVAYPPASWRLSSDDDLRRTVVWVSHIVISFDKSSLTDTVFRPPGWNPEGTPEPRSEAAAFTRAYDVRVALSKNPGDFARLAKAYSDDVVTKDAGGSLGGIRAYQLPSQYLDALATLEEGEVSSIFRIVGGFSIIQRHPMPPDSQVSGRRIVIRYQGTYGGFPGVEVDRKRADALQLATQVLNQLKATPDGFDALVKTYSENADRAQMGDIGEWSLRAPCDLGREVEQLGAMRVGEVSAPLDSPVGFEILQRTKNVPRATYAMDSIQLKFDPTVPKEHPSSSQSIHARALKIAEDVSRDPKLFEHFSGLYKQPQKWTLGRGPSEITSAVERLAYGQIGREPVESRTWFYVIPRRLDPGTVPAEPPFRYTLPKPERPDLEAIIRSSEGNALAKQTRELAKDAAHALQSDPAAAGTVTSVMGSLAASFENETPEARVESWRVAVDELHGQLSSPAFTDFRSFVDQWVRKAIMGQPR